jgi:acetate kinase
MDMVTDLLNKKSGLLGLSDLSSDVRELQDAAANGHEQAQLALNVFVYRLAKYIGALTVTLPACGCPGIYRWHRRKFRNDP